MRFKCCGRRPRHSNQKSASRCGRACSIAFSLGYFAAIVLLLASGYGLVFGVYGGFSALPIYVNLMQAVGIVMMLLFLHLYFAPWRRFGIAVARQDWAEGGRQLGQIRTIVTINLVLGLIVVAIGGSGPYWG